MEPTLQASSAMRNTDIEAIRCVDPRNRRRRGGNRAPKVGRARRKEPGRSAGWFPLVHADLLAPPPDLPIDERRSEEHRQGRDGSYPGNLGPSIWTSVQANAGLVPKRELPLLGEVTSLLELPLVGDVTLCGLGAEGMIILSVSHRMGFVRKVLSKVTMMDQGRLVEVCAPANVGGGTRDQRARAFVGKRLRQ